MRLSNACIQSQQFLEREGQYWQQQYFVHAQSETYLPNLHTGSIMDTLREISHDFRGFHRFVRIFKRSPGTLALSLKGQATFFLNMILPVRNASRGGTLSRGNARLSTVVFVVQLYSKSVGTESNTRRTRDVKSRIYDARHREPEGRSQALNVGHKETEGVRPVTTPSCFLDDRRRRRDFFSREGRFSAMGTGEK